VEMIKRGNIATILPTAIVNANPDLRAIPLSPPLPERTVALLSRRGAYQTAASIAFSDLLVRFISENNLL
jgi:LysR family cyn operon transcriptional activator